MIWGKVSDYELYTKPSNHNHEFSVTGMNVSVHVPIYMYHVLFLTALFTCSTTKLGTGCQLGVVMVG